jgi:hypothetical protein
MDLKSIGEGRETRLVVKAFNGPFCVCFASIHTNKYFVFCPAQLMHMPQKKNLIHMVLPLVSSIFAGGRPEREREADISFVR